MLGAAGLLAAEIPSLLASLWQPPAPAAPPAPRPRLSPAKTFSPMLHGKRIAVVLPAYNAAATLERTHREIPFDVVDDVILIDDASRDATVAVAERLGIHTVRHARNLGYGGNQKTCYRTALERGADVW